VVGAAKRWREALEAWAIPAPILAQAEESPWIHPPDLFDVPKVSTPTPSHVRAREALGDEASVLDVGCGGGAAAMALVPDVKTVIGVDQQSAMLVMFARNASERGLECRTILGDWPDVAPEAPMADVVAAHHVVYNVGDIGPFVDALESHARHRVVLELPTRHPLANMDGAWRHFWDLERPDGPTPDDLMDVLSERGIAARQERWRGPGRAKVNDEQAAQFLRVRLCLPASRLPEVREFLTRNPDTLDRELATIWWDVTH
jgi:SAM-dependent methyltransferase